MFELIKAGGWMMWPILLCSVVAVAIVAERFWSLRPDKVAPTVLIDQIKKWHESGNISAARIDVIREHSPLGRVLAAGLDNLDCHRDIMKESIEDVGGHVVVELERYLNTLGTIASITPLLGLLGTVVGMIRVFSVITAQGIGNATELSGGISEALITTAAGLTVAIPALIFYRFFRGRVNELAMTMEQEAIKLVELIHGERSS